MTFIGNQRRGNGEGDGQPDVEAHGHFAPCRDMSTLFAIVRVDTFSRPKASRPLT
jgi:hypothetical protein